MANTGRNSPPFYSPSENKKGKGKGKGNEGHLSNSIGQNTPSLSNPHELNSADSETLNNEENQDTEAYFQEEDIDEIIELDGQDGEFNSMYDDDDNEMLEGDEFSHMDSSSMDNESENQEDDEFDVVPENYEDHAQVVFDKHQEPVYAIACHPTLPYVLSGGGDDQSYVWDMHSGHLLYVSPKVHTDSVVCVGFSFDGKYYATGSMDHSISIHDVSNGQQVALFEASDEILWLDWHPKGNVVVCGTNDGQLWLWNTMTKALMQLFHGVHRSAVNCGQFTPNGKQIISGSEDGSLVLWDPHTAQPIFKLSHQDHRWFDKEEGITALKVHPNHTMVIVGGSQGQVKLVHLQHGQILNSFATHTMSIESIRFSSNLPFVAVASVDATVSILDLQHTTFRSSLPHPEAVTALEWISMPSSTSSSSDYLITTSVDGMVRAWDARAGQLIKTWSGHLQPILCLFTHSSEKSIITGSDDGTCRVFSLLDIEN